MATYSSALIFSLRELGCLGIHTGRSVAGQCEPSGVLMVMFEMFVG